MQGATREQFAGFLTRYGYSVDQDAEPLLALSLAFLSAVPLAPGTLIPQSVLIDAQCFIAYAMAGEGGGFNPVAIAEGKTLVKKGLGRGAVSKEWAVDELLAGTDPVSRLRALPMPYGLLRPYLCEGSAGVFVV